MAMYDYRYDLIIRELIRFREERGLSQESFSSKLARPLKYVLEVENQYRILDIIELADWLLALDYEFSAFFRKVGFIRVKEVEKTVNEYKGEIAVPVKGKAFKTPNGIKIPLAWKGSTREVEIVGTSVEKYLLVEKQISAIFQALNNPKSKLKNGVAIADALKIATDEMPDVNPSDVYQHIVYRLYSREYNKTNSEQSWKRASGDAMEIFIAEKYGPILLSHGIHIVALNIGAKKGLKALAELGIDHLVGSAKLDIALYGDIGSNKIIFAGVHCKASLAERVSDDVPCSRAMMKKGFYSYLYTFDSKSFPPPTGDLVNYGELGGRADNGSDKRKYIEEHGDFDACFSYNTRGSSSPKTTPSGKRIFVSSLKAEEDPFVNYVVDAWKKFKMQLD